MERLPAVPTRRGGLRWAAQIVGARASEPPPDTALRDLSTAGSEDADGLAAAVRDAGASLVGALRDTGPAVQMWCAVDGGGSAFYARRFAHETAAHRADAALALGQPFVLDDDVASDGVEEWLELGSMPFHFDVHPEMRELLGPVTDLLLVVYRRLPTTAIEVGGDGELVDFWLQRVAFG